MESLEMDGPIEPGATGDGSRGDARDRQRRALWIALVANSVFLVAEVVGGLAFGSLALLADAGHMASDVFGLGAALVAQALSLRPASSRHTYGLQRAEVIGALANALILLAIVGWIAVEAFQRLQQPSEVQGGGLLLVASLGLIVNAGSAVVVRRAQGRSLNMRGAFLHMAADTAGSLGAVVAGIAVIFWGAEWVDPIASLAIALLVLWSSWSLLVGTVHVLLEGAPRGLDPKEIEDALAADRAVESVHHLHLWSLASDVPALSAHVVIAGEVTLHEAQARGDSLKAMLARRFGIDHATLDLECHACEPPERERVVARGSGDAT
jgi:cobalt-zinc-cadmium efflux system protein